MLGQWSQYSLILLYSLAPENMSCILQNESELLHTQPTGKPMAAAVPDVISSLEQISPIQGTQYVVTVSESSFPCPQQKGSQIVYSHLEQTMVCILVLSETVLVLQPSIIIKVEECWIG
jgi:hypothetical protein